jgi:glycosyltransferase involved in cell wall biosynthesis
MSVFKRKNPLGLVDAFVRAFDDGSGAHLVIKSINHEHFGKEHATLGEAASNRRDITLIDRYVSVQDRDLMTMSCDCYVSLHRSEGLGMTMAEAMYAGKPVIATGYSGNLDFMTNSNSHLVSYQLVPVGHGAQPYPAHATWAEPNLSEAADLMKQVHEDRVAGIQLGEVAAQSIRETHSVSAAASAIRSIFS